MRSRFTLMFFFFCYLATAQTYDIAAVPQVLKNNASVVVHLENTNVEVEDIDKGTIKVQKIFTVLDEEGSDALHFNQYTNKYVLLDDAEVKVYDKNGRQTARYKKKDMVTVAVGEGLVEDGYVTYYHLTTASYPVTLEFNYVVKLKSIVSIPGFRFAESKQSVIESNYTIKFPANINIRYKAKFTSITPQVTEDAKYKTFKWTVKDFPAVEDEEGSVSGRSKFPYVNIVADQFSYYGNKGDLSSWKNFGSWIGQLYQGLDELPEDRQRFFQQMVKDAPDEREKVKRIYDYLQSNFRYVSIQLGVGGLKPFSAIFTDQKKYGDCKALSNYMKAALKSVDIRSYVAIINAQYNEEPVDADFPANDFNHVILCVPQNKDSIWLECTSSTAEFDHLGTFTENRNALLITEEGGVLVSTPKSIASSNVLITNNLVTVNSDFTATAETSIKAKGEFDEMINDLLKETKDDQKAFMVLYMGYKQPDDFALESGNAERHQAKMKMSIEKVHDFNTGDKYFINPRLNKVYSRKLPASDKRKLDFYFSYPFEKMDTTILKLPSNFKPDVLPAEKNLSSNYASYQSRSWFDEKEHAIYTATILILKMHKIPAADYGSVKTFFDEVSKDEAQKIVVKKTASLVEEKKAF